MQKEQFDLLIANPPYSIGNKVISACVPLAKESVVLMPLSKYKAGDLSEHIFSVTQAPDLFEGAEVGDSLTISLLKPELNPNPIDVELAICKKEYLEFYKLNKPLEQFRNYKHALNKQAVDNLITQSSFMLTMRTILDGTHSPDGDGADISYNLNNNNSYIPWDITNNTASCNFIVLSSSKEKDNMCRFWYNNPLQNNLIKGLGKSSGRCTIAIPKLDWSKDRPYETATLEDIISWIKEDNNL